MLKGARVAAAEPIFAALRREEFARLDRGGHAYLDYTGAALHAASQVRAHQVQLERVVFGNPHADHEPSRHSTAAMERARDRVLRFLDADPSMYAVCFTANATAAIKLVAESYAFGPRRGLILSVDNHNSVGGIREYARRAGAPVAWLPLAADLRLDTPRRRMRERSFTAGLLAFPAQSNFSGVRHPLDLVSAARDQGLDVLLDAAAYVPTHALSLRECPADFVAISFYKLFGYPTGLGALVARRDALRRLRRPWFAGGAVTYVSVAAGVHRLRPFPEGFEDGTPDFLGIGALEAGFSLLDRVGMDRLSAHVARLTGRVLRRLRSLRHASGRPLVVVYGPQNTVDRGGTIAFNVLDEGGVVLPFGRVEEAARARGVALRGGCFCNPGAAEAAFGLPSRRTGACLATLGADFTPELLSRCTGTPAGAVRLSIGLPTNEGDIDRAVDVIASLGR